MSNLPYAFDSERLVGSLSEIGPTTATINLRKDAASEGKWLHGHRFHGGRVGEFIVIECGEAGIFGRITEVRLPERERLAVEESSKRKPDVHPIATAQLLTTFYVSRAEVVGGIAAYPNLGSRVFSAHPLLVKWLAESTRRPDERRDVLLHLGSLPDGDHVPVSITPEKLFGRHCAVLGSTGGGKSFTLARLMEESLRFAGKVVVLDATGEYFRLKEAQHVQLGGPKVDDAEVVCLPYHELTEEDMFTLFNPGTQSQAPKLRAAIKSLKLAKLVPKKCPEGYCPKVNRPKKPFEDAYNEHLALLESPKADFEIKHLVRQIDEECVRHNGFTDNTADYTKWGNYDEQAKSYVVSLVGRIETMIATKELECIFKPEGPSLFEEISKFLADPARRLLRISLKYVAFSFFTREIVANAIGRRLMEQARAGKFVGGKPVVVMLDEAHHFLNKQIGDEHGKRSLDAFELIAKEGRKHWLTLCMATQRPRDIPEGVLSQMGTLIVHRLTNEKDRDVVEKASGDIDRSAAAFLPTLAPGEAAIIGVDFPIPLTVQVAAPRQPPDSSGPRYQDKWVEEAKSAVKAAESESVAG